MQTKPFYETRDRRVVIYREDAIAFLRGLSDSGVDVIVTDPASRWGRWCGRSLRSRISYAGIRRVLGWVIIFGDGNIPDVWKVRRIVKAGYPTQKPTEVFEL